MTKVVGTLRGRPFGGSSDNFTSDQVNSEVMDTRWKNFQN